MNRWKSASGIYKAIDKYVWLGYACATIEVRVRRLRGHDEHQTDPCKTDTAFVLQRQSLFRSHHDSAKSLNTLIQFKYYAFQPCEAVQKNPKYMSKERGRRLVHIVLYQKPMGRKRGIRQQKSFLIFFPVAKKCLSWMSG